MFVLESFGNQEANMRFKILLFLSITLFAACTAQPSTTSPANATLSLTEAPAPLTATAVPPTPIPTPTETAPTGLTHSDVTGVSTPPNLGVTEFSTSSLVEGRVVRFDDKTIRIATEKEEVDLDISKTTVIWDSIIWIANIPTKTGDFVTAWGIWNPDHSFAVRKLYVNIVNLQGRVSNIAQGSKGASFDITDQYQKTEHVIVSSLTEIYESSSGDKSTYQENPKLPQNGEYVEVVGQKVGDESVLAVNITLP